MVDEPVEEQAEETPEAEDLSRPNVLTRLMKSGGGRVDDELIELPERFKSIFEEPQPGSIMHTLQHSADIMKGLGSVIGAESTLDKFLKQNSVMDDIAKAVSAGSVISKLVESQRKHDQKMRELLRDVSIERIDTPAIKMVGLLKDMRDAMEESAEHNKAQAEALFADAVRQEDQIRQLREANVSLRQAVDRAEADAKSAEKSSEENRRLANIGITIGVVGLLLAIASIVVTVMTAKGS